MAVIPSGRKTASGKTIWKASPSPSPKRSISVSGSTQSSVSPPKTTDKPATYQLYNRPPTHREREAGAVVTPSGEVIPLYSSPSKVKPYVVGGAVGTGTHTTAAEIRQYEKDQIKLSKVAVTETGEPIYEGDPRYMSMIPTPEERLMSLVSTPPSQPKSYLDQPIYGGDPKFMSMIPEKAKPISRPVSTISPAPQEAGLLGSIQKKQRELQTQVVRQRGRGEVFTPTMFGFGLFGLGCAGAGVRTVKHPVETIKGIGSFYWGVATKPRETLTAVKEEMLISPPTFFGEQAFYLAATYGISKGVQKGVRTFKAPKITETGKISTVATPLKEVAVEHYKITSGKKVYEAVGSKTVDYYIETTTQKIGKGKGVLAVAKEGAKEPSIILKADFFKLVKKGEPSKSIVIGKIGKEKFISYGVTKEVAAGEYVTIGSQAPYPKAKPVKAFGLKTTVDYQVGDMIKYSSREAGIKPSDIGKDLKIVAPKGANTPSQFAEFEGVTPRTRTIIKGVKNPLQQYHLKRQLLKLLRR